MFELLILENHCGVQKNQQPKYELFVLIIYSSQMGFLVSGKLEAVIGTHKDQRTLQTIFPGTLIGELGLLSRGSHSRTIIASQKSIVSFEGSVFTRCCRSLF